jgi:nucleotide-binding universal stress UspA family protein
VFNKILLAVDRSDDAYRAVEKVIELQKKYGSEVVIFHSTEHKMIPNEFILSVPYNNEYSYTLPMTDYYNIRDEYIRSGKNLLKEVEERFKKEQLKVETRLIEDKEPANYIIGITKKEKFDLVVLGCKGEHSKLRPVLLGTVAQKVLNEAHSDVYIVR